jgi:S1-C subfamily serine protease
MDLMKEAIMTKNIGVALAVLLFVSGCFPAFVPVTDISKVSSDKLQAARQIKTYTTESNNHPEVAEYLGDITAYSCKHVVWDPPASKGDALIQLKLKAVELGADGIIDITFDSRGTDTWGTNCWESVHASGIAVKFNQAAPKNSTTPKQGDKIVSSGTGFFITPDGFIITAYHVIKDASKVKLVTNQGIKTAVVVKADSTNDIAILKTENAQYQSLPIKSSMGTKLGSDVFTLGFPNVQLQGFEPKYTKGNISSLSGIQDDTRHFQISTPVQPGNSGGPLIDSTGNVIGIVVAKMADVEALAATGSIPQNVNYAIKSSFALALLETLPEASRNLTPPSQKERNSADIVDEAQKAVVLIFCY